MKNYGYYFCLVVMCIVVFYYLLIEDKVQNEYVFVDICFSMCVFLFVGIYKVLGMWVGKMFVWDFF